MLLTISQVSKAYSEPSHMSNMEVFAKIVYSFPPLTIAKNSILDVWLGPEYASEIFIAFEIGDCLGSILNNS